MFNIGNQRIGILRQSKTINHWNNVAADNAGYKTLLYEAGIAPEMEFNVNNMALTSQAGTMQNLTRTMVDIESGLSRLSFSGPATLDTLHFHLASAMQSVTQGVSTPFRKTFTMASHSGMIDIANNQGHLFTLVGNQQTGTSNGWKLWNAILDELVITIERDAPGTNRIMRLSGTWVGTKLEKGKNLNGTWISTTIANNLIGDSILYANDEFTIDGMIGNFDLEFNKMPWKKFELRINNNISVPSRKTAGEALNYVLAPEVRFSLQFINNTNFNNFYSSLNSFYKTTLVTSGNLIVQNQFATNVEREVKIELNNIYPDSNFFATDNNYFIINFSGKATSLTISPLIIYLSDAVNAGY